MPQGKLFPDADLCGQEFADDVAAGWARSGFTRTVAFTGLVKAVSRGDLALEDAILRRWGVR